MQDENLAHSQRNPLACILAGRTAGLTYFSYAVVGLREGKHRQRRLQQVPLGVIQVLEVLLLPPSLSPQLLAESQPESTS